MMKIFRNISIGFLTFSILFAGSGFVAPQTVEANTHEELTNVSLRQFNSILDLIYGVKDLGEAGIDGIVGGVSNLILQLVSLLTALGGLALNGVIYLTVVNVADNYANIGSIDITWKVIRDIANMGFIFMLLYAAINTIIGRGQDNRKLIVKIVVVAILINFSLFFTKLIIDAGNILALAFYDAIAPGAASSGFSKGLSDSFMQALKPQSLYQATGASSDLGIGTIITTGIMGSIMLLVAAFVFFSAALMFVIRYVILIFVLILSPIAFASFVLPNMDSYRTQWKDALLGQTFFAPIYFALIWITLNILDGITRTTNNAFNASGNSSLAGVSGLNLSGGTLTDSAGFFSSFINYIIVIAFLIIALVIAKSWANKAGPISTGLTKWATGVAVGGVGSIGRRTIGRAGAFVGDNDWLKEKAVKGGTVGRFASRQVLTAGRGIGGASFDARGSALGGVLDGGKAGGKGGFIDWRKKKSEEEEKFAKSLAPSAKTIAKAKAKYAATKARYGGDETHPEVLATKNRVDELEGVKVGEVKKRYDKELATSQEILKAQKLKEQLDKDRENLLENNPEFTREKDLEKDISSLESEIASTVIPELKHQKQEELEIKRQKLEVAKNANAHTRELMEKEIGLRQEEVNQAQEEADARREAIEQKYKAYRNDRGKFIEGVEKIADIRKKDFADVIEKSIWAQLPIVGGYNYEAAAKIRKGKSAKDEAAEALKKLAKADGVEIEGEEEDTESSTPPENTPPTT